MRRVATAALGLMGTVLASGCEFDLMEYQADPRATQLALSVELSDRPGAIDVTLLFNPGVDSDGANMPLRDERLRVNGTDLNATNIGEDGSREYKYTGWPVNPMSLHEPLHIRSPSVQGIAEASPELTLELVSVVAPDTLIVSGSDPISIVFAGLDSGNVGLGVSSELMVETSTATAWFVRVLPDTSSTVVVSWEGRDPPAEELLLPASALPAGFISGTIDVGVFVHQAFSTAGGHYIMSVQRTFRDAIPIRVRN